MKPPPEFPRISHLPPYVLGQVVAQMTQQRKKGDDIINLGMGNPDLPTPPHIVNKLIEAVQKTKNHRYSVSRGIPKLRQAICAWYKRRYNVELDWDFEAIAVMGAKEGLSHLMLAATQPGDVVLVPNPSYPIHIYAPVIAGCDIRGVRMARPVAGTVQGEGLDDFFPSLERAVKTVIPKPKFLILSFPSNPTTHVVDLDFFRKVVSFAREHGIWVIHDLAYADLTFDGYKAPSILQVDGAKEVAVELYSLSKGYSMPGWRVGFLCGNRELVGALTKIKSYFDYGMFQPVQIAATVALNGSEDCVKQIWETYHQRRDVLCEGLNGAGWTIEKPKGTMFVWAKIPDKFSSLGSLEFSKLLLSEAKVCVSPGIGFGEYGEGYVRFALVENEKRIRQAVRGIKQALQKK
ncbi:MAG: aminotransferase class I/II-fold pyridoxal phosphate-dependent enzyme [Deltaproteobacteria bacterium]|nr:aminotransferase class I/II-fold pyridoxal phosphate-dependent enzyme [Deltaproteobacteria bacterium]